MGSKGSQTVTNQGNQTQTYTPNPAIGGAGNQAITGAQSAANLPFQQPIAPVAPFSPYQSIGFGETLGLQGMAQPYFNTAGNYLAGSAAPVSANDVANYYNPMAANVTAQMQNIFGQQNVQNTGNLVQSAGGVGADRVAVGQANMANQQALAAGQTYAGLYQSALQAAQQQKQMEAGAGFAFGQMGPAAQAAQQNAVNQLLGVGAQQQGLTQQELNAIYQNQLAQIAYPFQTPQYLAGITAGLAPGMGGTTTGQYYGQTTYPSPSPLAQGLGLGMAGLGLFGQMGGLGALGGMFGGAMGSGAPMQWTPNYGPGAYGNGYSYPMYDDGGAVNSDYGDLAKREKYEEYGRAIPAAAMGNPIAETFLKDVGYDDGGKVIPVGDVVPFNQFHNTKTLQEAIDRIDNRKQPGAQGFAGAPQDAVEQAHDAGVLKIHPLHGYDDGGMVPGGSPFGNLPSWPWQQPMNGMPPPGTDPGQWFQQQLQQRQQRFQQDRQRIDQEFAGFLHPTPAPTPAAAPFQTPSMSQIPPVSAPQPIMPNVQLPSGPQQPLPPQQGGQPFMPASAMQGTLSPKPLGLPNFDDGGSVDIPVGQASPMSLTIDPTNAGLPYPGAGKVHGSPVPSMQLPQGQPGKSGPFGQFIYGLGSHSPSMPQGGGQQGNPMQVLGQLGGSIGKLFGSGAGAGASAGDAIGEELGTLGVDLIGARRGGRMDTGGATTDMNPHIPLSQDPDFIDWQRQQKHDQIQPPVPPKPNEDVNGIPMSATGGGMGGDPPGGSLADNARRWQGFESRFPKDAPPVDWNMMPYAHGNYGKTASGGVVDPMRPGAGYGDDDIDTMPDTLPTTETNKPTFGEMLGNTASQIGSGLGTYKRWMFDEPPPLPDKAPIVPPEAQSQYASEGHPRPASDRPFEGTSMWDEAKGYGPEHTPGFTDQHFPVPYAPGRDIIPRGDIAPPPRGGVTPLGPSGPQATPSPYSGLATMDQPYAVAANRGEPFGPTSADIPMNPLGHGMGQGSLALAGPQGAMGVPAAQSDMMPYRRATMVQETWLPGDKRGDPYQHVETTRNARGMTQHALGAYGIMDFNLNDPNDDWGKQALGRHITPQELLAHPEYQDAIYDYKMRDYIKRFGVEGAGRVWLGGEGALNAPLRSDPLGGRVGPYGANFASLVRTGVGAPGGNTGVGQGMMTTGMRPSDNVEDLRGQGPMGSAPMQRGVPFPNATDPNSFARRMSMSPWSALTNAGVQIAQSRGPIGSVIAGGIGAAQKTFAGQQQELNSEQAINDKAEQLAILAQAHLNQYTRMTPYQQEEIAERKQYHNAILNLRGSTVWNQERTKLEAEPAWMGRNEEDKDVETARRITEGRRVQQQGQGQGPEKPPGVPDNAQFSQKSGTWWTPDGKEWGKPESAGAG